MRNKRGKKEFMAVKINLEKTYDRINWNFLFDTMLEVRLLALLIDVIMTCVRTSNMRILWNGSKTAQFFPY